MAMTARLPQQHFLTRDRSDTKLAAGLALLVLVLLAGATIRLGLIVAGLDVEVGQVYELQREVRSMKDDARAQRLRTANGALTRGELR